MGRDPIEATKEFKDALEKIQPQLDLINQRLEEEDYGMGRCHIYWEKKKELLKRQGIDWHTPAECNPHIIFD